MYEKLGQFIDGKWQQSSDKGTYEVINPATEEVIGKIAMGNSQDVDKAVAAAKEAFESFSQTTKEERLALMGKILEVYQSRYDEIAETICLSPRTVGTHLYNIKQKLNANNSAEIALIAIRCGLLEP